jgi:hypothetical protein
MPRYYFDTCDGGDFIRDAIGLELDGIEAGRDEAAPGLADFADPRNLLSLAGTLTVKETI